MTKKSNLVLTIVLTALFGVCGVAMIIASLFLGDSDASIALLIFGILLAVLGALFLGMGLMTNGKFKRREKNIATPGTIANKIAGQNSKFTHFTVVPDAAQQSKDRAVQNAIGAATFLFLGVGFFSTGKTTQDIFVSDDELFISHPKNLAWDDAMFNGARSSDVVHVNFATAGKSERVTIQLVNGAWLVYDIAHSQADPNLVRKVFERFANNAAASPITANAQTQAVPADGVFPEYDPSQDENVVVCPNCGVIISPDAKFCTNCGKKID